MRRLSIRQREMLTRTAGYVTNPLHVRYRVWRGIEQHHRIEGPSGAGIDLVLPPDHSLPFYQRRDPTYDTYAIGLLGRLAEEGEHVTVIDVGANVGDTAAAVLASHPATSVVSVEGSPVFLPYLRRNLAPHADRATVVEGFVGPVGSQVTFTTQGSTGGFQPAAQGPAERVEEWVTPASLLDAVERDDLVVWKSDIDGFDIHVLTEHWHVIDARCDVVWFEFDSPRTLGDRDDVERLIAQLEASGRSLLVYDNLGRLMLHLRSTAVGELRTLSRWLHEQYAGHITVPYLDVWALTPRAEKILTAVGE